MSNNHHHNILLSALSKLLRPLVRHLLHQGITCDEFVNLVRKNYVCIAENEFPPKGRKQSLTNIALVTGIHRHVVKRLKLSSENETETLVMSNGMINIVNGWLSDARYSTEGIAKILDIETAFTALVNQYNVDVTTSTALNELLSFEAIRKRDDGSVQLLVSNCIAQNSNEEAIGTLKEQIVNLTKKVDQTLQTDMDKSSQQSTATHRASSIQNSAIRREPIAMNHRHF